MWLPLGSACISAPITHPSFISPRENALPHRQNASEPQPGAAQHDKLRRVRDRHEQRAAPPSSQAPADGADAFADEIEKLAALPEGGSLQRR